MAIFDTAAFFKSPQSCCLFLLFTKFAQLKLRIRACLQMFWLSGQKTGARCMTGAHSEIQWRDPGQKIKADSSTQRCLPRAFLPRITWILAAKAPK